MKKYLIILLVVFGLSNILVSQTTFTVGPTASGTFVVPCGVSSITVQVWGAGGAGGGSTASAAGAGGGAGGYNTFTLSVLSGDAFTYSVGTGGSGSTGSGTNGGISTINGIIANGGTGGVDNGGAAGTGGTTSGGGTGTNGGNGVANTGTTGGNGGAAASGGTIGTGATVGNNGTSGGAPGSGGGGGGGKSGGNTNGGAGGAGQIKITYNVTAGACNTSATTATVTSCGIIWTDAGDLGGDFPGGSSYIKTFCSSSTGSCVTISFSTFDLYNGATIQNMSFFNGTSVSSPTLGPLYTGSNNPGQISTTPTNTTGCITVSVTPYSSTLSGYAGWQANVSCAACPSVCVSSTTCPTGQPCDNGVCLANANNYINYATQISSCGTSFNTTNSGAGSAYSTTQSGCGTSFANVDCNTSTTPTGSAGNDVPWSIEDDIWYKFCPTTTGNWTVSVTGSSCSNSGGYQLAIFQGVPTNLATRFYASTCQATQGQSCVQSLNGTTTVVINVTSTVNCVYIELDGHAGAVCNFAVSLATSSCLLLPVELISFNAFKHEDVVNIDWITATEKNCKSFSVEKSKDGVLFETLIEISGSGTSLDMHKYSTIDEHPFDEVTYYRLKETNTNGEVTYFNVISVDSKTDLNLEFNIIPNPNIENVESQIIFNQIPKKAVNVIIYDINGVVVFEETKKLSDTNAYLIPTNFARGVYIIKIVSDQMVQTKRLLIK